jgi:purine nucleoside phosphorylase
MVERFGYDDAKETADFVRQEVAVWGYDPDQIRDGVILGSGLGDFPANHMNLRDEPDGSCQPVQIPYQKIFDHLGIEDDTQTGIPGHAKQLIIGPLDGTDPDDPLVFAQAGREHLYEGVDPKRAVFWLRVMQLLKVRTLIGSNAAGILTPETLKSPSLILVHSDRDLAASADSPLIGPNEEPFGTRFPHKADVYTEEVRTRVNQLAEELGIDIKEGTYMRVKGPTYESPEEVYDLRNRLNGIWEEGFKQTGENRFGGTPVGVVGMSSTYEAVVAQHATLSDTHPAFQDSKTYFSVATNYASSLAENGFVTPCNHEEVQENAKRVGFGRLVHALILANRDAQSE